MCLQCVHFQVGKAGRRLSAEEVQKLPPMACRYLAQVASSLDSAIQDAADEAGVGNDYHNAVNQYRQGMRLNDAWKTTKRIGKGMLTRIIQNAP